MLTENMKTVEVRGVGIGSGRAAGKLYFVRGGGADLSPDDEQSFWRAVETARGTLDRMFDKAEQTVGHENAEIFEVYRMMLEDDDFLDGCVARIRSGARVADAVSAQADEMAERFRRMDDEYLAARADDISGLAGIVNQSLGGSSEIDPPPDSIVVAQDLTPYQTVMIDRGRVKGFVTFGGSKTSHTAILARALGIPALVRADALDRGYDGCTAVIDAGSGTLTVNPDEERMRSAQADKRPAEKNYGVFRPVTRSGKRVELYANIGSADEAETALRYGAAGIGLMRTELVFLNRRDAPTEDEQFEIYKKAAVTIGGLTVIRTLDIGADKQPDFLHLPAEENPALGVRGIRTSQVYPELFRTQIRAILRASAYGKIAVMFPMISDPSELAWAREMIDGEAKALKEKGIPFDEKMQMGIMIETPAAALTADRLAEQADFFSVGSNDLCQYVYADDRQNSAVAGVIPDYPEAVLKLIRTAAEAIHKYPGKWIGVCGELAADTDLTAALIEAGADELSMSPACIPEVAEKLTGI